MSRNIILSYKKSISTQRESIYTKAKVPRGGNSQEATTSSHKLTEEAHQHLQRADVQVTGPLCFCSKIEQFKFIFNLYNCIFLKRGVKKKSRWLAPGICKLLVLFKYSKTKEKPVLFISALIVENLIHIDTSYPNITF